MPEDPRHDTPLCDSLPTCDMHFAEIERKLDQVCKALLGNGQPGLIVRVALNERRLLDMATLFDRVGRIEITLGRLIGYLAGAGVVGGGVGFGIAKMVGVH